VATTLGVGRILVADRDLHDPSFSETVIVILSYDDDGAGGVILNRPSEIPVSRALKEFPEARGHADPVFEGGPVSAKHVLALLHGTKKLDDAEAVIPGVFSVGTTKLLRQALADKLDVRVFAGYAGWRPGQLEEEVQSGAWHVERGQSAIIFDDDPGSLWQRMIKRLDTQVAFAGPAPTAPKQSELFSRDAFFRTSNLRRVPLHNVLLQGSAAGAGRRPKDRNPVREAASRGPAGHNRI
jgi:putative transcriptional regulator